MCFFTIEITFTFNVYILWFKMRRYQDVNKFTVFVF